MLFIDKYIMIQKLYFEKKKIHKLKKRSVKMGMQDFLRLSAEIFMIICIQSILEVLLSGKRDNPYSKVIFFAGYVASLALVLNFVYEHFSKLIFMFHF